jgi:hypothetical protein
MQGAIPFLDVLSPRSENLTWHVCHRFRWWELRFEMKNVDLVCLGKRANRKLFCLGKRANRKLFCLGKT